MNYATTPYPAGNGKSSVDTAYISAKTDTFCGSAKFNASEGDRLHSGLADRTLDVIEKRLLGLVERANQAKHRAASTRQRLGGSWPEPDIGGAGCTTAQPDGILMRLLAVLDSLAAELDELHWHLSHVEAH